MVKLRKIFIDDVLPSTGAATIAEAEWDVENGVLYFGAGKVVPFCRVREAEVVPVEKPAESTPVPAPIVRKGPAKK